MRKIILYISLLGVIILVGCKEDKIVELAFLHSVELLKMKMEKKFQQTYF